MINLSQYARQSPQTSISEKICLLKGSDIYLAENIADYKEHAPKIKLPLYQKIQYWTQYKNRLHYDAGIILMHIGIEMTVLPNIFRIHDSSGEDIMYWNKDNEYFGAMHSYEEARQNLKDNNWAADILVRYLIESDLPTIIEMKRYKFSNKKPDKNTLAERIRELFSDSVPVPCF